MKLKRTGNPRDLRTVTDCLWVPALAGVILLSGCGGGSNVRRHASPPPAPPPPTVPDRVRPQPASKPTPPKATNSLLALTTNGGTQAHADGYTGKGQSIAIMDNGFVPLNAGFTDRVKLALEWWETDADGTPAPVDITRKSRPDSATNYDFHGTGVANVAAGIPFETKSYSLKGGMAPDASLYLNAFGAEPDQADEAPYEGYTRLRALPVAMEKMLDDDVHIFSFSISGDDAFDDYSEVDEASLTRIDRAFPSAVAHKLEDLVDRGALLSWAAGNGGYDRPSGEARAPAEYPRLEKGWIAVVALDDQDPRNLADYSNQCGDAMAWCIAAPGAFAVIDWNTTKADNRNDAFTMSGTSAATPQVSGTAALVGEAFPWMSMPQVRASILTTATDLGAAGVDSTFGWGLLNAGRAVRGPAWLTDDPDWAIGTFDVGSHHANFGNDIAGPGSLIMDGASDGVLRLSGYDTYAGGTVIKGGNLWLSGLVSSDVMVQANGRLFGAGWVDADLRNHGTVESTGTAKNSGLNVSGNYVAYAGSTTDIELGHPLIVGGTAKLDGTLIIRAADHYDPEATEILVSAKSIDGRFADDHTSNLGMYDVAVEYAADKVSAEVTRKSTGEAVSVSAPTVVAAAGGLEKALQQADTWSRGDYADHRAFLDMAARFLSASGQRMIDASVKSLSGQVNSTISAVAVSASQRVDRLVTQHEAAADMHAGTWATYYNTGFALSEAGYASARATGHGRLAGIDIPVSGNTTFGLVVGASGTEARLDALAGHARARGTLVGVYARTRGKNGTYVESRVTRARTDRRIQREALIGPDVFHLASSRGSSLFRASASAGRAFTHFTPHVAVSLLRLDQDRFTEHGAMGFGLTADDRIQNIGLVELGLRGSWGFDWIAGHTALTGHVALQHVMFGQNLDFTAALAGAPRARFTVTGQSLARNSGEIGAAVRTRFGRHWAWSLDADYRDAGRRFRALNVNLQMRYRF